MDCVVCEKPGGYNRVVVELESGHELGGLCVECESRQFGEFSDELGTPGDDTCLFCGRDGLWALPKWLPSTYEAGDKTITYVDYDATKADMRLCDEHLAKLGVRDVATPLAANESRNVHLRPGAEE